MVLVGLLIKPHNVLVVRLLGFKDNDFIAPSFFVTDSWFDNYLTK